MRKHVCGAGLAIAALGGCGMSNGSGSAGPGQQIVIHSDNDLIAFQDGDGPWTRPDLPGAGDGSPSWTAVVHGTTYAVAAGCGHLVKVYYRTTSDPDDVYPSPCNFPETPSVAVTVDLQGVQAGQVATVWVNGINATSMGGPTVVTASVGPSDVLAGLATGTSTDLLYRGATFDLEQAMSLQIDLAALALPPDSHPLTVTGADAAGTPGSSALAVSTGYHTAHADWQLTQASFALGADASYMTLDPQFRRSGELTTVAVEGSRTDSATGWIHERTVGFDTSTPGAQAVTLPPELTISAPPTLDASPDPRISFTLPDADHADALATIDYQLVVDARRFRSIRVSAARAELERDFTTPDLSGIAGWNAEMALDPAVGVDWSLFHAASNLPPPADYTAGVLVPRDGEIDSVTSVVMLAAP